MEGREECVKGAREEAWPDWDGPLNFRLFGVRKGGTQGQECDIFGSVLRF